MAIDHDNIIYIKNISELGGVESFAYYMAKEYQDLDIAVLCISCDARQMERIKQYCPVYIHHGEDIECKKMIINWDTSILDYVRSGEVDMIIHGDYTQPNYTVYPNFHHPKIHKIYAVTQTLADRMKEKFGIECECCYNPFVPEKKEKRLTLVSATRLSEIKGGWRMKALSEELDRAKINYVWYVFTNDNDCIHSPNVIFIKPRLSVYKWIMEADLLVQLSDTEAMSYSINEARAYGCQTLTTPLPYLEEINITRENALILEFDLSNMQEIIEKIKIVGKVDWQVPKDNYRSILAEGESRYKEMKRTMKRVRVVARVRDSQCGNIWREVGDELVMDDKRAVEAASRGYVKIIEDLVEHKVVVERAVKEEKKEKAIKVEAAEKVVPEKKAAKKNAKK